MCDIMKQIEAKNKAIKVIESCNTLQQLKIAENYVNMYNNMFSDFLGYSQLKRLIIGKEISYIKN